MKTNYKLPQYTPDAKKRIIAHGHKHINSFIDKINEHFVVSVLEERFGTPDGFRPNNPTSLNRHKTSFLAIFRNKTAKEISDDKDTWTSFGLLWFAYGLSLFDLKPQQIINRIKQNPENFFNQFLDTNINQSDLRQFYEYSFLKSNNKIIEIINKYPEEKEISKKIEKLDSEKKLEHLVNSVERTNAKTKELIEISKEYRKGYTEQLEKITQDIEIIKSYIGLDKLNQKTLKIKLTDVINNLENKKIQATIDETKISSLVNKSFDSNKKELEKTIQNLTKTVENKFTEMHQKINLLNQTLDKPKQNTEEANIKNNQSLNVAEDRVGHMFDLKGNYDPTNEDDFIKALTSNLKAIGISKKLSSNLANKITVYIKYGFCINFIGSSAQLFTEAIANAYSNKFIFLDSSSFVSNKPYPGVTLIRSSHKLVKEEPVTLILNNINLSLTNLKFPWLKRTVLKNHTKTKKTSEILLSTINDELDQESTEFMSFLELGPIINTDWYLHFPAHNNNLKISKSDPNISLGLKNKYPDEEYDDMKKAKEMINSDMKFKNKTYTSNILQSYKILYDHFLVFDKDYNSLTDILLDWILPNYNNVTHLKSILDNKFEDTDYIDNSPTLQKIFEDA